MFSRLKGALDSLEESARSTRQNLATPPPPQPPLNRSGSTNRTRDGSRARNAASIVKDRERDPGDFESDFGDGPNSRPSTPAQNQEGTDKEKSGGITSTETNEKNGQLDEKPKPTMVENGELPAEVKTKLRKLEKMETKYTELLRSYRITHAKVQLIEPFEKVLRENTPCTSIADPGGFTEYLNNLSLRSDMTMEEFKRVSKELSDTKVALAQGQKESQARVQEIETLKSKVQELEKAASNISDDSAKTIPPTIEITRNLTEEDISTQAEKLKSPSTMSISSLKPTPDKSADFFSFEEEQDRLDTLVATQDSEISNLKATLDAEREAKRVAEEAVVLFQKNIEDSQRELEGMRETMTAKDGEIRKLLEQSEKLEKDIQTARVELQEAQNKVPEAAEVTPSSSQHEELKTKLDVLTQEHKSLEDQLSKARAENEEAKEKYSVELANSRKEKDELAELQQTKIDELAKQKAVEIEDATQQLEALRSDKTKEIEELQGKVQEYEDEMLMLRGVVDELGAAKEAKTKAEKMLKELMATKADLEGKVEKLKKEKALAEEKVSQVQDQLVESEKNLALQKQAESKPKETPEISNTQQPPLTASQKKNKKKKKKNVKGVNGQPDMLKPEDEEHDEAASDVGHDIEEREVTPPTGPSSSELIIVDLRNELANLRKELEENETFIGKLKTKATKVDDLQEEMETLRDSLLEVGNEGVAAKDKMQDLLRQKNELEQSKAVVEAALDTLQTEMEAYKSSTIEESKKSELQLKELQSDIEAIKTSSNLLVENTEKARKDLHAEFEIYKSATQSSMLETEKARKKVEEDFHKAKDTMSTMQSDLNMAQQLAASRFKDLTDHRQILEKTTPELQSLRAEVVKLNNLKNETNQKLVELKRLERVERDLKYEIETLKKKLSERELELDNVKEKSKVDLRNETAKRSKAEENLRATQKELRVAEDDRREATDLVESTSRDLTRAQEELSTLRPKIVILERDVQKLNSERDGYKEEIDLKTAQHSSAQSLMQSLRDQTNELAMQMKELKEKNESQEDELAESHKLLGERSREAETMRRMLNEVETRNESRTREMKERMEQAIDERDRAEEEAATASKRRAREIDDLKDSLRDAEKSLKRVSEERDEAEKMRTDLRAARERADETLQMQTKELDDTKKAMVNLRDALDETEKQIGSIDKERAELRKKADAAQTAHDKIRRQYRLLEDELRAERTAKAKAADTATSSSTPPPSNPTNPPQLKSRTSSDMSIARRPSVTPTLASDDPAKEKELEYLKNVILQSLEVKDKKVQLQMLPVLTKILRFDKKDEQRWMSVVASIK